MEPINSENSEIIADMSLALAFCASMIWEAANLPNAGVDLTAVPEKYG